jgi:hypothetical protein
VTGPEHFAEAERLLAAQKRPPTVPGYGPVIAYAPDPQAFAEAQVHATLALAAATALYDGDLGEGADTEYQAWKRIAGSEVTS